MSNPVRDAFAVAQQMSAANNNTPFELHIQLNDGTDIHGVPYPMDPQLAEPIRLMFLPKPDPTAPFPPPSDRWIAASAVLWVEIEWLLGADTGSGAPASDMGEDTEPGAAPAMASKAKPPVPPVVPSKVTPAKPSSRDKY